MLKLTSNAVQVLESRYLLKNEQGEIVETPEELFQRVAKSISSSEGKDKRYWFEEYEGLMRDLRFIPNSPTLMNAGKKKGQLSACFVLPIGDSLDSIFNTLKYAAKIHQSGGGTGFSFSHLRSKGSLVRSTHGVASGPVSFIRIFDAATETVKQGGTRRGANMAILRVDHPDILEFVQSKLDQKSILNFNISVGVTREFMTAVEQRSSFALKNPHTGKTVETVQAHELFEKIAQAAWECGDPGLIFLDQINRFNPTPQEGEMESTNPCGEQPLLPFESCNLGSLNLTSYFKKGEKGDFHWKLFKKDIQTAVRFLDSVIDLNSYPIPQCRKITLKNRKIGLGVMGFADLLLMKGVSYSSQEALELGSKIMSFLNHEAKQASAALAKEKGAFPNWKGSLWKKLGYPPLRNATVSTVAPTGTISMIAGVSSGIEPLFSGVFYRNILDGKKLLDIHPMVERLLKEKGVKLEGLTDAKLQKYLGPIWSPAAAVPIENHIHMQAVFQKHSDSAVSKTINLPRTATVADVIYAYKLAYELGCKGITVYRDQSRSSQVLEKPREKGTRDAICAVCE